MIREVTKEKAMLVKAIVDEHYERGRQDRSKAWVFRTRVIKTYPMTERSFWRLLKIAQEK